MSFRIPFFCLALVSATTAFGQQPRGQENGVTGTYVFVPDGQQIAPAIDPRFQQPVVVQPHQHQHSHQHGAGCSCNQCQRTVVGRTTQIFAKTHMTKVTTEHSVITHPVQSFNESPQPACPPQQRPLCPPQNFCGQQGVRGSNSNTGGISSWDKGFWGYNPQQYQQRGGLFRSLGSRPLVSVSADVAVLGYGPRMSVSVGRNPPMQALPGRW